MLSALSSAALQGIDAELVHVEVNTGESGEPKLILVGLPDAAVKESDDRVFSALSNSGFKPPRTRTTINLAPGHLRKEGPFYDLPIALGILIATQQAAAGKADDFLIAGELSLSGATRPVRGALAMGIALCQTASGNAASCSRPPSSALDAALVDGIEAYPIATLDQAVRFLSGEIGLTPVGHAAALVANAAPEHGGGDFSEIKGQHGAAAGGRGQQPPAATT